MSVCFDESAIALVGVFPFSEDQTGEFYSWIFPKSNSAHIPERLAPEEERFPSVIIALFSPAVLGTPTWPRRKISLHEWNK